MVTDRLARLGWVMKLARVAILARRPELAALLGMKFSRGTGGCHGHIFINWTWIKQPSLISITTA